MAWKVQAEVLCIQVNEASRIERVLHLQAASYERVIAAMPPRAKRSASVNDGFSDVDGPMPASRHSFSDGTTVESEHRPEFIWISSV